MPYQFTCRASCWILQVTLFFVGSSAIAQSSETASEELQVEEASISDIRSALATGSAKCTDIVEQYLERISAYNLKGSAINAVITVNPNALAEAAQLDATFAQKGFVGPLHCVTVLVKDQLETNDLPTTYGSALFAGFIPPRNATVVNKIESAGAIVIGKAAMGEFASAYIGSAFGFCRNVYDPTRNPSGSSCGTGTGVAASFATVGIAEDTGGSTRGPAAVSNAVGLRPTTPLISRFGVLPASPSLDTLGPLTRTVEDTAILLDVIAGYDPKDPITSYSLVFLNHGVIRFDRQVDTEMGRGGELYSADRFINNSPRYRVTASPRQSSRERFINNSPRHRVTASPRQSSREIIPTISNAYSFANIPATYTTSLLVNGLAGKRIGVIREPMSLYTEQDEAKAEPESEDYAKVKAVIDAAIADLRVLGAEVVDPVTIPNLGNLLSGSESNYETEVAINNYLDQLPNSPIKTFREIATSDVVVPTRRAALIEALNRTPQDPAHLAALAKRDQLRRAVLKVMADNQLDALVYATFDHQPTLIPSDVLTNPNATETYGKGSNRSLSPYLGFPALTVPAGFTTDKLPVGIEFLGLPFAEDTLIQLGYGYEQGTMHRQPPSTTPPLR